MKIFLLFYFVLDIIIVLSSGADPGWQKWPTQTEKSEKKCRMFFTEGLGLLLWLGLPF
jgi:hypothetical protein